MVELLPRAFEPPLHPEQRGRRGRLPRSVTHIRHARMARNRRAYAADLMARALSMAGPTRMRELCDVAATRFDAADSAQYRFGFLWGCAEAMGLSDPRLAAQAALNAGAAAGGGR